ncbi:unnamed protein product [Prunus armeniaca]
MEPKPMLLATASCQGQGVQAESMMLDRLSHLPDEVTHHAFSFLDLTDVIRVGCVSKRCREFYLSTQLLKFDLEELSDMNISTCSKRLELMSSLDRFLFHRGDNKIESCRINWVKMWIYNAV